MPKTPPPTGKAPDVRQQRLADQLRANLQRRKAQSRSRRQGEADSRTDGLPGAVGETLDRREET